MRLRSGFLRRNVLQWVSLDGTVAFSVDKILDSEQAVAYSLEDAADLECQRDLARGREEPENLHGVSSDPAGENGQPEALARLGLRIGDNLRDREGSFDGEADVSDEHGIRGIIARRSAGHDNLANKQAHKEVEDELPISSHGG